DDVVQVGVRGDADEWAERLLPHHQRVVGCIRHDGGPDEQPGRQVFDATATGDHRGTALPRVGDVVEGALERLVDGHRPDVGRGVLDAVGHHQCVSRGCQPVDELVVDVPMRV